MLGTRVRGEAFLPRRFPPRVGYVGVLALGVDDFVGDVLAGVHDVRDAADLGASRSHVALHPALRVSTQMEHGDDGDGVLFDHKEDAVREAT